MNDEPIARVSRTEFYLGMAQLMGLRKTCPRAQGGTIITLDNRIITTGYAGAPRGMKHCLEAGCLIGPDGGCQRTLHAEIAAISFAARHGIALQDTTLYTTIAPCYNCAKAILNAGIIRVIFEIDYRITTGIELLQQAIQVEHYSFSPEAQQRFMTHFQIYL